MIICEEYRFSLSEFDNAFLSLCSASQINYKYCLSQPRSQGSLPPTLLSEVGENPGNEVVSVCFLFQESRYYYKIVPCSKVPEIEEELNKLLSGKLKNYLVVSLLRATPFSPTPHPPTATLGGEGG